MWIAHTFQTPYAYLEQTLKIVCTKINKSYAGCRIQILHTDIFLENCCRILYIVTALIIIKIRVLKCLDDL